MDYNRVEVTVGGKKLTLKVFDDTEYIKQVAKELDKRIEHFLDGNDTMDVTTAAILAGMDILDESFKMNSNIDNIRTQIKSYVEEAAKYRIEAEKFKKELEKANLKIEQLQTDVSLHSLKDNI